MEQALVFMLTAQSRPRPSNEFLKLLRSVYLRRLDSDQLLAHRHHRPTRPMMAAADRQAVISHLVAELQLVEKLDKLVAQARSRQARVLLRHPRPLIPGRLLTARYDSGMSVTQRDSKKQVTLVQLFAETIEFWEPTE